MKWDRYYYEDPHFTHEEIAAKRMKVTWINSYIFVGVGQGLECRQLSSRAS
jgi:hypothetical protein